MNDKDKQPGPLDEVRIPEPLLAAPVCYNAWILIMSSIGMPGLSHWINGLKNLAFSQRGE